MTTATLPPSARHDLETISLIGFVHGVSHFFHLLLPPLFPWLMDDFDLSFTAIGVTMTVFFIVSGIGQAAAGFLVDRFGAARILGAGITCFALAGILLHFATGYPMLIAVAAIAGLGNSVFHPADFTVLNRHVSQTRLGHAFSIHGLSGNLGWALAPVFFAGITALWNWRMAYFCAAGMYVLILGLLLLQRDHLRTEAVVRHADAPAGSDLAFMKLPVVWWCFGFFLLSTMTLAVVQSFSVSILKAMHNVSFEAATMTLTAYMLCGALGMLLGGFVAARMPRHSDRVVAVCMTVAAVCLGLCATGLFGATGTMVVLAATGLAVGIGGPSRDMMIKRATPVGATGRIYGTVYSGLDAGLALSPLLFGTLMDRGRYEATLAGAGLVLLLAVLVALGVGRRTMVRT